MQKLAPYRQKLSQYILSHVNYLKEQEGYEKWCESNPEGAAKIAAQKEKDSPMKSEGASGARRDTAEPTENAERPVPVADDTPYVHVDFMEHSYVSAYKLDFNKLKKFVQGEGWKYVCKI